MPQSNLGSTPRIVERIALQAQLRAAANGSGPPPVPMVLPVTGNPRELKNG